MALSAQQIKDLNNAYNRPGGQTATDKTNIAYGQSQGWTPPTATVPVAPVVPPATTTPPASINQANPDPSGSLGTTPTPGGTANGLDPYKIKELDNAYNRPGGQNAIDKQNIAYAVANYGYKPPTNGGTDFSNVNSIADANSAINSNQAADVASGSADQAPPTRTTIEDIMAGIKSTIAPATPAPTAPNLTQTMADARTKYGVTDLENSLNDLKAQEQEIYDQKKSRITAERGKSVAMNVISGRIGQVEQQENERLAVIQRGIATATNQLNTKYNVIDSLMKTTQADYQMASESYDKQMSQNITLFNAAKNIQEEQKTDNDKEVDNARASAQILLNSYQGAGKTYDSLASTEKTTLTKLSVMAGLGADFFSNVLQASAGKDILTQIKSDDDTQMSIIYKDGTSKVIPTGLKAKPKASSGSGAKPAKMTDTFKAWYYQTFNQEADPNNQDVQAEWGRWQNTGGESRAKEKTVKYTNKDIPADLFTEVASNIQQGADVTDVASAYPDVDFNFIQDIYKQLNP